MENFNWKNYAKVYDKYTPSFQNSLLKYIGDNCYGNVCDLGCGVGKLFKNLENNPNVTKYIGIDSEKEMLKLANIKRGNKGLKPILSSINYLDDILEDESFDTITLVNVLYALDNPIENIGKIKSKIKKGGRIIISNPSRTINYREILKAANNEFDSKEESYKYLVECNNYLTSLFEPKTYNCNEMENILELLDFKVIKSNENHYLNSNSTLISQRIK